jgi:NAD-dependent deacetylase
MKLVLFTGAGISAESGISTFRDSNGLWENYDPMQVASLATWRNNYKLVHDFYNARRRDIEQAQPNLAHEIAARWQAEYGCEIITQNIDDLFEKAGAHALHVHGNITEMKCVACGLVWDIGYNDYVDGMACPNTLKKCQCKKLKPNVVFFGEVAPNYPKMYNILASLGKDDVIVVCGTSGQVIDIKSLIFDRPCLKIIIDPNVDMEDHFYDVRLKLPATEGMQECDKMLKSMFGH